MSPHARPRPPAPAALDLAPARDPLARAWDATRPADPSPELLDALWAHASAELDRIAAAPDAPTIPFDRARPGRRRALAGLALAAAALVLAGVAWQRPARRVEVVVAPVVTSPVVAPPAPPVPAARGMVDVEVDKILFVQIDDEGHQVRQLAQTPTFPTIPEGTQRDLFDALESAAAIQ